MFPSLFSPFLSSSRVQFQSLVRELRFSMPHGTAEKKLSFCNVDEEIIDTLGWERFANVVEGIIRKTNLISY